MKVLFIKDLPGRGARGEVKDVRDGYARNFLIPSGVAAPATPGMIRQFEQQQKSLEAKRRKRRAQAAELRDRINKSSLTIPVKAGQDDRLFGAVTTEDIAAAMREQMGIEVNRHEILLDQPIKKLGIYKIAIRLAEDIEGELKLWVVNEK